MKSVNEILKAVDELKGKSPGNLNQILKKLSLKNIVCVISPSDYRSKKFLASLTPKLKALLPDLESSRIIGPTINSEDSVSNVRNQLSTLGLFSKSKLTIFFDLEKIISKFQKPVLEIISKNTDQLIIVFCKDKKSKILTEFREIATSITVPSLSGADFNKWVKSEAKKLGVAGCEDAAIKYLAKQFAVRIDKTLEINIDKVSRCLIKASLLTEPGQEISLQNAYLCAERSLEDNMSDLFKAVALKNNLVINKAIKDSLDAGTHPLQMVAYFSKALKTLIASRDPNQKEHSKDLHNKWFLNYLEPNRFSDKRLSSALAQLAQLEFDLKNNSLSETVIVNQCLTKI